MNASLIAGVIFIEAIAGSATRDAESDAVLSAALEGAALALLPEEVQSTGAVACFWLDYGDGPVAVPEQLLNRFQKLAFVRDSAACERLPEGAFEKRTGAPAYIIAAGPIEWLARDDTRVTVVHQRAGSHTTQRLYRVVRERRGWVSLGQILQMAPA